MVAPAPSPRLLTRASAAPPAAGAGATTAARQARLGADRAMRPGSPGSQEDARAAAALAWRAQFESPPPPPWWRRLWPWAAPTQRLIRVAPLEPHSGSLAAPAELRLPASQLEAELGAGLAPAVNAVDPRDDAFFSYNSSAMTPLVPLWLSWMTDLGRMANRSHGLDFSVRASIRSRRGAGGGGGMYVMRWGFAAWR